MTADEKVLRDILRDAAASAEPRGDAQASRRRGTRLRRRRFPPLRPPTGPSFSDAWWNGTDVVFPDGSLELHFLDPRTGGWSRFDKPSVDLAPQAQPLYVFDGRNVLFVAPDGLRTRLFVLDGTNWREAESGPLWRGFTPTVSLGDGRLLVLAREQSYLIQGAK